MYMIVDDYLIIIELNLYEYKLDLILNELYDELKYGVIVEN